MEERRGARVATTFHVGVEGIDPDPTARQGNISQSGVYFETGDANVGGVGTIHWLSLMSADGVLSARVMAYVVRTVAHGRFQAAAFEFMPESDEALASIQGFVKYVMKLRDSSKPLPHIAPRLDAQAASYEAGGSRGAVVGKLSVKSMVLETSWAVSPGESLRVDIAAPGMSRRIRLEGKAIRVAPNAPMHEGAAPSTFTIEVEVHEESDRPLAHSSMSFARVIPPVSTSRPTPTPTPRRITAPQSVAGSVDETLRSLDDLLASLIVPPGDDARRTRAHPLSGQLASVPLTTLVALFEMERMTGRLVVRHDIEEARLYIDGGRILDVEPLAEGETGRSRVREILGWKEGAFEFDVRPVPKTDRIGTSTTALLLDLAREDDEAARDRRE